MKTPRFDHPRGTLVIERGNYFEVRVRGNLDVDVYEDDPDYRSWVTGFRLARDTVQGSTDEKES
jgi:hypothetical protein